MTTAGVQLEPPPTIDMEWSKHFDAWSSVRQLPGPAAYNCLLAARRKVPTNTRSDWLWLADALGDSSRKIYVAIVFQRPPVPKCLLDAFLRAAVFERKPSLNRIFIEPCIRSWGGGEVNHRLLRYLQDGTNEEKAVAASAFYWAVGNPRCEDLSQLLASIQSALLREFIANEDVSLQQRILPLLRLDEPEFFADDRPLVEVAVAIARAHANEYIRHRVEVQLGHGSGSFVAMPSGLYE